MTEKRIYLSPPHMGGNEAAYVREAFDTNWIAPVGPQISKFEEIFAAYTGSAYAVAVSSGTAALHMALRYAGVGAGDEVLVSNFTFIASVSPAIYLGATPIFIDSEESSWNMDPDLLESVLSAKARANRLPKALIIVHLYGQSADMDRIIPICQKYGVTVVEDAAEALGARYGDKASGTFGQSGIFSFNGNKIITTSGGGMVVTDDPELAEKVRFWSTQAKEPVPHYEHKEIGYNYRLSNVAAAIGRGQMEVLADRVRKKRQIFQDYCQAIGDLPGISFMPEPASCESTRWLTCMTVDPEQFGATNTEIMAVLEQQNIESRPLWKPMHLQPVFKSAEYHGGLLSEQLFKTGLCLPSGTATSSDEFDRIYAIIRDCCRK